MLRLLFRLFLLFLGVLVIVPPGLLAYISKRHDISAKIAQYYFTYGAWVMRLRVHINGSVAKGRPLLLVSNHISYLDIFALASSAPIIFTPKSEIGSWPLVGFLCKLMGCVFIERRKLSVNNNISMMDEALNRSIPVVLFAEGTTSDSKRILPLRSSMFQVAENRPADAPLYIQPVFLHYYAVHNLPMDMDTRHKIAWYGDMSLLPHMLELIKLGPIDVKVGFLLEVDVSHCKDRKEMASILQQILSDELARSY